MMLLHKIILTVFLLYSIGIQAQKQPNIFDTLHLNIDGKGNQIEIIVTIGKTHNYPSYAIWIEDTENNFIQTIYVSESIAKGEFAYGKTSQGNWMPGELRRPAALPYWSHKRGIKEHDGLYIPTKNTAIADAYTGATPLKNFIINANTDFQLPEQFKIYLEVNQSWDWNEFWTNNKFPEDNEYKTSCQPALVYCATIDKASKNKEFSLEIIGHSHYSGKTGELFTDITSITTALQIIQSAKVILK